MDHRGPTYVIDAPRNHYHRGHCRRERVLDTRQAGRNQRRRDCGECPRRDRATRSGPVQTPVRAVCADNGLAEISLSPFFGRNKSWLPQQARHSDFRFHSINVACLSLLGIVIVALY